MKAVHALLILLTIAAGFATGYLAGNITSPAPVAEQVSSNKTGYPIMHLSLDKEEYLYGEDIRISYYSDAPLKRCGPPYIARAAEFKVYRFENDSWKELVLPDLLTKCVNGTIVRTIPLSGAPNQKPSCPLEQVNVTRVWNATYYGFAGSESCEPRLIEPGRYKVAVSYEYKGTEITVAKEFNVLRTPATEPPLKLRLDKDAYKQGENITIAYYSDKPVTIIDFPPEFSEVTIYKLVNGSWEALLVPWGLTVCKEGGVTIKTPPRQTEPHLVNSTLVWDGTYYVLTGQYSCEVRQIGPGTYKVVVPYEYKGTRTTVEKEFSVIPAQE